VSDNIPDITKMIGETPRTDTVNAYIRTRRDFKITDHQMWQEHGKQLELKLNEMERLAAVRLNYINQLERELKAANERIKQLEEMYEGEIEENEQFLGSNLQGLLIRELNWSKERIKRLEDAGDKLEYASVISEAGEDPNGFEKLLIAQRKWNKSKEAKP